MPSFDFVPIKLKFLPVDLYLECKIFSRKPGEAELPEDEFALLCENQTMTGKLIDRLKRSIFPDTKIYIERKYVVDELFDKGHLLGFKEEEVTAIRNHENPWESQKAVTKIPKRPAPKPKKETNFDANDVSKSVLSIQQAEQFKEIIHEYNLLKTESEDMLKTAAKTGKIDKEKGEKVTRDIQTQIRIADNALIIRAINQIRNADEYLHTHCMNVALLNGLMGKWLNYNETQQSELVETGLFHDLGKVGISDAIIHKPEPLSPDELKEMKKHPVLSMEMLMKSGVRNKAILEGVIQHHERVNGTGYPKGLPARDICEYARITAISDTYDAMVTKRVFTDSHSPFEILSEFQQGSYSELDFNYINVFIDCMVEELKGKEIIMNDGREARVVFVDPRHLRHPMVEIDGKIVKTDDSFYCARMKNILEDG
ncbi:MAG: HD domain-containing protein [Oscillospiraceae bacterium]|nr:HD domain-containing protein [Oscillospiraceae bacterium]